jgi:peptidoglycan/LPS O-acetylase OafA/YrhL
VTRSAPSSSRRLAYQPALDGLRALAVLAVIGYHDGYGWASGGFLGVDAFFVLSGYLITSLLVREWGEGRGIALVAFWGRRIRRLLPALLLVLLFVAAYAYFVMPSFELDRMRGDGLASLFYVANWRFVWSGQSYFDLVSAPSPVRHLWSLAIEEQFYLVWPLVVLACLRLARGSLRLLAVVCVVGAIASVWLMDRLYVAGDPSRAYYGTDARMHTILVGCLLALLFVVWAPQTRAARVALQVLGVVGGVAVLVSWHEVGDKARGYYGIGSLAFAVAVAVVIAAAVQPGRGPLRTPLGWSPLRWIGMISYGLYLWHWPINLWLTADRVGVDGNVLNLLRLAVTFAAAGLSFVLVERPLRERRFSFQRGPAIRWVVPSGIALVGVTLVVSTAGAQAPPSYLGGGGGRGGGGGFFNAATQCVPTDAELAAGRAAYRVAPLPVAARRPDAPRVPVMVLGDSTACSLLPGIEAVAPDAGMDIGPAAVIGCGIVTGEVTSTAETVPAGGDRCPQLMRDAEAAARAAVGPPGVVLWMSVWEKNDLVVDGERVAFGSARWREIMEGRVDAALARLTADGARVLLVTQPSHAEGRYQGQVVPRSDALDREFTRLNRYLRTVAAAHPDRVTLVDLAEKICPGGPPCAREVAGRVPRPIDGAHFTPEAAVWVSEWLVPQLRQAVGDPGSGVTPRT